MVKNKKEEILNIFGEIENAGRMFYGSVGKVISDYFKIEKVLNSAMLEEISNNKPHHVEEALRKIINIITFDKNGLPIFEESLK